MSFRENKYLSLITLAFFVFATFSSPILAQSQLFAMSIDNRADVLKNIPVTYVTQTQAELIVEQSRRLGYEVREGDWGQLAELEQSQQATQVINKSSGNKPECQPEGDKTQKLKDKTSPDSKTESVRCADTSRTGETTKNNIPPAADTGVPPPLPPPVPEPVPQPQVQTNVGIFADVSYGSGRGSQSDVGKVFFIVAGFMVIAAFVVYAGKYISDLASGEEFDVWWEFIFSNTYLSTRSGQHGRFNGIKIGTGFVSSDLIQVALVGELGNADFDLVLDENSFNPVALDFSATYWLLGATARLHLSDKLVNASYLYLEFMGGQTDHGSTDTIGMARLGASFGINNHLRLGASIGSVYLGLDEDQGFANNGDNYWTTLGFEIGAKF